MMVKNGILFFLTVGILSSGASCKNKSSISAPELLMDSLTFQKDSIWLKTYVRFSNEILRPQAIKVIESVCDSTRLPIASISLFNMLVQSYDCRNLKVSDFQTKYPFTKTEFVEDNFKQLVLHGLLIKNNDVYELTDKGEDVLDSLENNYQKMDDKKIDTFALGLLKRISSKALSDEFKGVNKSIQNCKKASLRFEDSNNNFLQLLTVMNDLAALRNDQSHYRYSLLKGKYLHIIKDLNHPMKELLAGIFYNQSLNPKSYLSRPTWGYSKLETEGFLGFLIDKGLILKTDSIYTLTDIGKTIEDTASSECEKHFYEPWLCISKGEYQNYKRILQ